MAISPTSINVHVNTHKLLAETGTAVKDGLPTRADCPLCHGNLYQYPDPIGGAWYACTGCKFAGDNVELFMRAKKLTDAELAVRDMVTRNCFLEKPSALKITQYLRDVLHIRKVVTRFWETCQQNGEMLKASQGLVSVYQKYGIWPGYHIAGWSDRIGQHVGGTTKQEIRKLPIAYGGTLSREIAPFDKTPVMVVPAYDLPGRIRAFQFFTAKGHSLKEMNIRPGGDPGYSDTGLCLFDNVFSDTQPDAVYAVRDTIIGLQLQMRHSMWTSKRLPLVTWHSGTTSAWTSLRSGKLVLWDFEITEAMLVAAITHDALVTTKPDHSYVKPEKLEAMTDVQFLAIMQNTARSWPEAVRDYLLARIDHAALIAERLRLLPAQQSLVLSLCTPKQQTLLQPALAAASVPKEFGFSGHAVVEAADGYYEAGEQTEETRISSVKLLIQRQLRYTRSDRVFIEGLLLDGNQQMTFKADKESVAKDPAGWLEKTAMDAGWPQPVIHSKYRKTLLDLALAYCKPPTVNVTETLGWTSDNSAFNFKHAQVCNGQVFGVASEAGAGFPDYGKNFTATPLTSADLTTLLSTPAGVFTCGIVIIY